MRMRVQSLASLSGLRTQHCCELWCRLTDTCWDVAWLWLWPATPRLGTSICRGCSPKKTKKKNSFALWRTGEGASTGPGPGQPAGHHWGHGGIFHDCIQVKPLGCGDSATVTQESFLVLERPRGTGSGGSGCPRLVSTWLGVGGGGERW